MISNITTSSCFYVVKINVFLLIVRFITFGILEKNLNILEGVVTLEIIDI